jgi:hypothetical protein
MSDEVQEVRSGSSSVEVSQNAKGEKAYKVKVYAGTEQGELDLMVRQAVDTLAKLIASA